MATYYARNVTGNWAATTSWDSASSGGAGPAGPPVAGDTAIFDSGFTGTITTAAAAACTTLTVQAGATGTLALGTQNLTVAGAVTLVSGFGLTGTTGKITVSATSTITTGGVAIPNLTLSSSATYTLADALTVTGTLALSAGNPVFAGAFGITCDVLSWSGNGTFQMVSGQTLTVTTTLSLPGAVYGGISTIRATSASSDAFLHFNGLASACRVSGITFTDINCAHAIDNWYGGTLTRTTGITNRTSADFATTAEAGSIISGTTISGVAGTYHEAAVGEVQTGVTFGPNSSYTGTYAGAPAGGGGPLVGASALIS